MSQKTEKEVDQATSALGIVAVWLVYKFVQ